jgi:hypothetical protein
MYSSRKTCSVTCLHFNSRDTADQSGSGSLRRPGFTPAACKGSPQAPRHSTGRLEELKRPGFSGGSYL